MQLKPMLRKTGTALNISIKKDKWFKVNYLRFYLRSQKKKSKVNTENKEIFKKNKN